MKLVAPMAAAASTAARYEALIRVSEALRAYHDRDTLFRSLARELRPVVRFSFLGLALYDEQTHVVEPYVLEATGEPAPPPELSTEEQLTYWVVQHQKPLIIPIVEEETRFSQEMEYLRYQRIQSTCCLPLTTPRRRVGMLLTGSREPHVYDEKDVTFLSLVANQVALAIDDTLTYGALQAALVLERERLQNLDASDDLLRALSPVLNIREVFPRISQIASTVLPHDRLTLTFHDGGGEVVVQAASDPWEPLPVRLKVGHLVPEGDGFGIISDLETDTCPVVEPPEFWDQIRSAGYRSVMAIHLTARDQLLGLQFWAKRPRAFEPQQVPVARRIADHVALAVSHEQLAEIARQAAEAKLRAERLEARVKSLSEELAVRTGHGRMVGPSAEWQAVLKAATQVAVTDTTVLLEGGFGPQPHRGFIEFFGEAAVDDGDWTLEGAKDDAAWASLTRLTAARGRRIATVPRLQDCRPRSVLEAGGPGSSLALAATNRSRAAPRFIEVFGDAALGRGGREV